MCWFVKIQMFSSLISAGFSPNIVTKTTFTSECERIRRDQLRLTYLQFAPTAEKNNRNCCGNELEVQLSTKRFQYCLRIPTKLVTLYGYYSVSQRVQLLISCNALRGQVVHTFLIQPNRFLLCDTTNENEEATFLKIYVTVTING